MSTSSIHLRFTFLKGRDSYIEFSKSACGISVSKEFCKTKFNKATSNQKYIFEFVNRIGAYITYIFIESLRALLDTSEFEEPSTEKKTKTVLKRRASISYNLIHKSIDLDTVFEHFYEHIIRSFRPSSIYPNTKTYAELINEASNIFKKVYPRIPDVLEKKWQNEVADHTNWLDARREAGVICDHEWNEIHIFKLPGKYYFCRKCSDLIDNTYRQQIS